MADLRTAGQPAAVAAVLAMAGRVPHALLLVGPPSVGKRTLAEDLAALLLCTAAPADRPCWTCRSCRRIVSGNHPDVHVLAPAGPADRIGIGGEGSSTGVRDLVAELALRPVEGPIRIAIVERAHRLTEDAQHALLKTLEEPPPDTCVVLCADEEDALLETVRSRCARLRLGPVGTRAIEQLLADRGLADPPTAARLARLARGRPGIAVRMASMPEVLIARGEIARTLLDLGQASRAVRLAAGRDALGRAIEVVGPDMLADDGEAGEGKRSAAERRRGAQWLIGVWRDVAFDVGLVQLGGSAVRQPDLLEETMAAGAGLEGGAMTGFLARLDAAARRLDASASPELTVDVLALRWPAANG